MEKFNSENSSRTYRRELNAPIYTQTPRIVKQQQMLDNLLFVNRAEKNMNSSHLECREAPGEGAQREVERETAAQEEGGYGGEEAGYRVHFLARIIARFS